MEPRYPVATDGYGWHAAVMTLEVRALTADDWPVWRDLRLRALADSPSAFGSTLAREQGSAEADWRELLTGLSFAAYVDGVPAAIGAGFAHDDRHVMVVAMWTDPDFRGRGAGGEILEAVVAAARERGLLPHLFVMQANPEAARLYERHGFVRTGLVEEHGGRLAEELQADP
ncbi:MAG: hypothetical protein JWO46_1376 [Nocardioidaceae bacterium]|nr:hypothetical protein [Nocardioidaceae bacterium]